MAVSYSERYRPLGFLAALGAGGLSVGAFMYPMFLVKHPETPIPTYETMAHFFATASTLSKSLMGLALGLVAVFALTHIVLLFVNLAAHARFVKTDAYLDLRRSNSEVTLMAIPLTLGMTINVLFVVGALSVPGLWGYVEPLFWGAIAAFTAVGIYGLMMFGRYLTRILAHSGFNIDDTNHFSQVLPSFAFTMISVGLATPAAMTENKTTALTALTLSLLFGVVASLWILVKLPVSFGMMLRSGMSVEAGPTLLIGIPILTMTGIAITRNASAFSHHMFGTELPSAVVFPVLVVLLLAEVHMILLGVAVMRRQHYFTRFITGPERSLASLGLICPGVALSVLSMFAMHWVLVKNGLIVPFSAVHIGLIGVVALIQLVTAAAFVTLTVKLMRKGKGKGAVLAPIEELESVEV